MAPTLQENDAKNSLKQSDGRDARLHGGIRFL